MPELPEAEQTVEEKIVRLNNFDELKEIFAAKEEKEAGGVVNISFLRHCKPVSDERDAPLGKEGREQAEELARTISQKAPFVIAFGPLSRAKETAEIMAAKTFSEKVYLVEDARLNKPSWNLPERRFGEFVSRLGKRPPKSQARLLQMFYGAVGEEAMAEEPAKNLESFLDDFSELASVLPGGCQLKLVAITHIETMMPYLIRRWGLNLFGLEEWKPWRELRGIKEGSGFKVSVDMSGGKTKKVLEIAGERFTK